MRWSQGVCPKVRRAGRYECDAASTLSPSREWEPCCGWYVPDSHVRFPTMEHVRSSNTVTDYGCELFRLNDQSPHVCYRSQKLCFTICKTTKRSSPLPFCGRVPIPRYVASRRGVA